MLEIRNERVAPPRRESSGSMASAFSAEPQWLINCRKVAGPTLSERISLSQAILCFSVSAIPDLRALPSGMNRLFGQIARLSRSCFRCRRSTARYWCCASPQKITVMIVEWLQS